jgi:2-hydroxy-3-keto-5-methylthiopentenyl-1-phosphate phosphatase
MAERARPRLVLDWDGTVVEEDVLGIALARFGDPDVVAHVDPAFERGEISWAEAMELEVGTLRAPLEAVNAWIAERVRIRPGFHELVARFDAMILTGNLEELVRPVLAGEGLDLPVVGHGADPRPDGWRIRWNQALPCDPCRERGGACKASGLPSGPLVYVGDSISDHCAAAAAARVFARDGLARYLARRGIPFEPFESFHDVLGALEQ